MTTLNAASASQSREHVPSTRQLLWSGGVVEVKIPNTARTGRYVGDDGAQVTFVQFTRSVKGGMVNLFVHTDNPTSLFGETIFARPEVYRKDITNGRSFLYVDLKPLLNRSEATHRLIVIADQVTPRPRTGQVFEMPTPLTGAIAIIGANEKAN